MTVYGLAAAGSLAIVLAISGYALLTADRRVAADPVRSRGRRGDVFILTALANGLGAPLTGPALRLLSPWSAGIRRRIDAAGRPGGMTLTSYARQTAGYVVLYGGGCVLLALSGQLMIGLVLLLGIAQGELLLFARSRERQDHIQRSMPDFLDVLAVTVEAGLSFRLALGRIAENMPGPLAEEFTIALRQLDLGSPRREAFTELRKRNKSEALTQFVTAILQAEELGAPLATALQEIARDMRRSSAQWAKRKAQRNTPKVTMVTLVLSLPALMGLIGGALFYSTGGGFGGLFGT